MRELHHKSGGYLKNKSKEHLVKAILYGVVSVFLLLISTPRLPTHIISPDFDNAVTLLTIVPVIVAFLNLRVYRDYRRGMEGERRVKHLLDSEFGNEYYIINDIEYVYDDKGSKANIDHIVLAPNGIFVIETKATKREITYKKDYWYPPFRLSPSKQVGWNVSWVKKAIDEAKVLSLNVWVEPIIVFSNDAAKLTVVDPEIEAVVELKDLPNTIKSFQRYTFSLKQLETIGEAILKKASGTG